MNNVILELLLSKENSRQIFKRPWIEKEKLRPWINRKEAPMVEIKKKRPCVEIKE
jgi:DNA-directed RNA polymerase subunit H (RpoH/RPB5)